MSTAQEIIDDALASIGVGSEFVDVDSTITNACLNHLISCMETLRKRGIILEGTVSGTTTTVAVPSALSDELNEPAAARMHLINYLASHLVAFSRAPTEAALKVPPMKYSERQLWTLYYQDDIPNKVPSKLLPRGQGGDTNLNFDPFFRGEALDNDAD